MPPLEDLPFYVAILSLLGLSLYTIIQCKADKLIFRKGSKPFLFRASRFHHSVVSQVVTLFSLTYFAGGMIVYGNYFKTWYILTLGASLLVAAILLKRTISAVFASGSTEDGNILLGYFRRKLSPSTYSAILWVYGAAYYGLLVEELAVSRGVLACIFPESPVTVTLLLLLISSVIIVYVTYGGFRAVIRSDYHQAIVFLAFTVGLVYLVFNGLNKEVYELPTSFSNVPAHSILGGISTTILFFLAWLVAPIDLYSRMNLHSSGGVPDRSQAWRLVKISIGSLFFLMLLGIVFGAHLDRVIPRGLSPEALTASIVSYFLTQNSAYVLIAFLVGIFCMMFTTIDTLLIVLLQIGSERGVKSWLSTDNLAPLYAVAIVISTQIDLNSAPVFGVFVASLLLIPLVVIDELIYKDALRLISGGPGGIYCSLALSVAGFGFIFSALRLNYEKHFLVPGIVVLSVGCVKWLPRLDRRRKS